MSVSSDRAPSIKAIRQIYHVKLLIATTRRQGRQPSVYDTGTCMLFPDIYFLKILKWLSERKKPLL